MVVDAPDKAIGREKKSTLHLWRVPAQVQGLWCAPSGTLAIEQRFQHFSATLSAPGQPAPVAVWDGRIDGTQLRSVEAGGAGRTELRWDGSGARPVLHVQRIDTVAMAYERASFTRCGP